jgi:hypothetical protein
MVSPADGIDADSAAICRGVRALGRGRLLRRLGAASPETLVEVEDALATLLGLAQLVALPKPAAARRKPGALAGRIAMAEDFDSWPEDVARALGIGD